MMAELRRNPAVDAFQRPYCAERPSVSHFVLVNRPTSPAGIPKTTGSGDGIRLAEAVALSSSRVLCFSTVVSGPSPLATNPHGHRISEPGCTLSISGLHHFWVIDPATPSNIVLGPCSEDTVCPRCTSTPGEEEQSMAKQGLELAAARDQTPPL